MQISDWRDRIDFLDRELVRLLNERARCALEIGKLKRSQGLPVLDPLREEQVLSHIAKAGGGPLSPEALRRIFRLIIAECRQVESDHAEGACT